MSILVTLKDILIIALLLIVVIGLGIRTGKRKWRKWRDARATRRMQKAMVDIAKE